MNSLDRIIGVLFKETSYASIINDFSSIHDFKSRNMVINPHDFRQYFDLSNNIMIESFSDVYQKKYFENYSKDEINVLLSWVSSKLKKYYGEDVKANGLFLIEYIVDKYLSTEKDGITISFDNLLEWNGFTNKLDHNIFYSSYLSSKGINDLDPINQKLYISHDNKSIKEILKKGISENHMHLKGSGYSVDWSLIAFLTDSFNELDKYSKFLKTHMKSRTKYEISLEDLAYFKLRIMHFYLWSLIRIEEDENNQNKIYAFDLTDIMNILSFEVNEVPLLNYMYDGDTRKIRTNEALIREDDDIKVIEKLKFWQDDFKGYISKHRNSPMIPVFIQRKVFKYIFETYKFVNNDYKLFIYHTYVMGINQFKLNLIHDNTRIGFSEFKKYEDIKSEFMDSSKFLQELTRDDEFPGGSDNLIYESVFDKYYQDKNVDYIEFRITPRNFNDLRKIIDQLDYINEITYNRYDTKSRNKIKFGIIYHYIKVDDQANNNSLKNKDLRQLNYQEVIRRKYKTVNEVFDTNLNSKNSKVLNLEAIEDKVKTSNIFTNEASFRRSDNSQYYLDKLVAVDTANYEIGFRPYLFTEAFHSHREKNNNSHRINFTYHVGEDYLTLANGLRAIDEVIEFLDFKRGDRLGHAIALGVKVDDYFKIKRKKIHTTLEDYIDDLVWMHNLFVSNGSTDYDLIKFLEYEFEHYKMKLSFSLKDQPIYQYYDLYRLKKYHYLLFNDINGFHSFNYRAEYKKLSEFHKEINNFYMDLKKMSRGLENLLIDADERYIDCVKNAQNMVWKKVIRKDLSIETNPSSNFKISHIRRMIDLPLFSFNKYKLEINERGNIPVSINTDDSSIFQTNLSMEYAIVACALYKDGYAMENIFDYIDFIRDSSIKQSFINQHL